MHTTVFPTRCRWPVHISRPFDIEEFRATLDLFVGRHNFINFMKADGYRVLEAIAKARNASIEETTCKDIQSIEVTKGLPSFLDRQNDPLYELFDFYNVRIKGFSFLHNQVGKGISAMAQLRRHQSSLHAVCFASFRYGE